jgi:predicted Rossmann fold nucleotide-binding protein DprA/Smf involved in DNA uptake
MISAIRLGQMGNRLNVHKKVHKKNSMLGTSDLIEMGKEARKERDRLLKEYPDLREYQKEIDRCLDNAGSTENRMAVLAVMIEAKLKELQDELSHLSIVLQEIRNPDFLSDTLRQ